MDDRSKVVLLIGYHNIYSYKLYCPVNDKVEVSGDVIVKESETWNWSKAQSNSNIVSTLKSDSASKGDSDSKRESEFKDDSDSEGESDSDDRSDSKGDPTSKGGTFDGGHNSEGDPTSEGILPLKVELLKAKLLKVELLKVVLLLKVSRGHIELDRYQGDLYILSCCKILRFIMKEKSYRVP